MRVTSICFWWISQDMAGHPTKRLEKGHFIGLSLGSIVVRIIAKENPQHVSSMVLAGAVTRLNTKVRTLLTLATTFKRLMEEDDKLFLPQVQQTVRNGGDNVSLVVVPNAGHVCNVNNKRFFYQHSLEFMQSVAL